jgi:hypothetical protein
MRHPARGDLALLNLACCAPYADVVDRTSVLAQPPQGQVSNWSETQHSEPHDPPQL